MPDMNSYSWCPVCKCWVWSDDMNYDTDDTGKLLRICNYCMGKPLPVSKKFVYEPYHESIQCIYCDSYNTEELAPQWGKYKCRDCEEEFWR